MVLGSPVYALPFWTKSGVERSKINDISIGCYG